MATTTHTDNAASEAVRVTDRAIVRLKEVLERVLQMRVEVTKLEFNMLDLYHTTCPEELESLRNDTNDLQNANIIDNDVGQN